MTFDREPVTDRRAFVASSSNNQALDAIDRWPDWPGNVLAIHGPPGCGKTHLANIWQAASKAVPVNFHSPGTDIVENWIPDAKALVLEDGDRGVDETLLFHVINMVREDDGYLLLTSRVSPARWNVTLADLCSRLKAVRTVEIGPPDDELIAGLMAKLFRDCQVTVGRDVVSYLSLRTERSFAAVAELVRKLDRYSLEHMRPITVPLAREVLGFSCQGDSEDWMESGS